MVNITRGKEVLVFCPKIKVLSKKKKRSSLRFHPRFPDFIPKIKVFSKKKKKGLHIDFIPNFLILFLVSSLKMKVFSKDFLFCYRNQTLPTLIHRKHVLPKLTQCAAKRKYCAGVPSLLRGRAGAQLRGNRGDKYKWNAEYCQNTFRFRVFIPRTGVRPVGMNLSRTAWVKLNRLRTGVG